MSASSSNRRVDHPLTLTCPYCGKLNTHHTNTDGDKAPEDGDIAVCIDCGGAGIFDMHERCLRLPTEIEVGEMRESPEVRRVIAAWLLMNNQQAKH